MSIFNRKRDFLAEIEIYQQDMKRLVDKKSELTVQIAELKHKHKLEKEDIEHLVRIKQEKLDVDFEKKTIELERNHAAELNQQVKDFNEKMTGQLSRETDNIKSMYEKVLERLPNVSAHIGNSINKG